MSRENVEVVEKVIASWNARDLDAVLQLVDPKCEYVNAPAAVEPGTRHGHEGLSVVLRKQWEGLGPDARQHVDRAHPRGNQVVVAGRVSRQMPGSSTQIENPVATRWTLREGRVIRLEVLGGGSEFRRALEAAGLSE